MPWFKKNQSEVTYLWVFSSSCIQFSMYLSVEFEFQNNNLKPIRIQRKSFSVFNFFLFDSYLQELRYSVISCQNKMLSFFWSSFSSFPFLFQSKKSNDSKKDTAAKYPLYRDNQEALFLEIVNSAVGYRAFFILPMKILVFVIFDYIFLVFR